MTDLHLGLTLKENKMVDQFLVADIAFRNGDALTDADLKVLIKVYTLQYWISRSMKDKNVPYEKYLIQAITSIDSMIYARKRKS